MLLLSSIKIVHSSSVQIRRDDDNVIKRQIPGMGGGMQSLLKQHDHFGIISKMFPQLMGGSGGASGGGSNPLATLGGLGGLGGGLGGMPKLGGGMGGLGGLSGLGGGAKTDTPAATPAATPATKRSLKSTKRLFSGYDMPSFGLSDLIDEQAMPSPDEILDMPIIAIVEEDDGDDDDSKNQDIKKVKESKSTSDDKDTEDAVDIATRIGQDMFRLNKLLEKHQKEIVAFVMNFVKGYLTIPDSMFGGKVSKDEKGSSREEKSMPKFDALKDHKSIPSKSTSSDKDDDEMMRQMVKIFDDANKFSMTNSN